MKPSMLAKLDQLTERLEEVNNLLMQEGVTADMEHYRKLTREHAELEPLAALYRDYVKAGEDIKGAQEMLSDPDMKDLAQEEIAEGKARIEQIEIDLQKMLLPKDPNDERNIYLEIRAGTGGDEAALFAGDLYRMYMRYCEKRGWRTELVDYTEGTSGGYKEIVFNVLAEDAYGTLKYESGVHRVQRVPDTETQGRVHTSAASVVVLPEVDEFDIDLQVSDIRKDLFCASGPGGQSVNTTYSAVRLTHIPTGIVAQCQDQKSQLKNYDKALQVLRSRVYEMELQKHMEEVSKKRKTMVSTGDRSAKVRTYNYPQGRVTEHRIGLTIYNLPIVMNGDLQEIMEALQFAENAEKLKEGTVA